MFLNNAITLKKKTAEPKRPQYWYYNENNCTNIVKT